MAIISTTVSDEHYGWMDSCVYADSNAILFAVMIIVLCSCVMCDVARACG